MALDRQSIEKRDFPIGRRGYEPEAVDSHLAQLADEVDTLRRSSRRRSESLATAASEQVRAIVEAAETSAAEIQRQAENEAKEIRADANRDAEGARAQAASESRDHIQRVSGATDTMLQRLEAMDSELGALTESLRTGANRLVADLSLLQGNLDELSSAAVGGGGAAAGDRGASRAGARGGTRPTDSDALDPQAAGRDGDDGDDYEEAASAASAGGEGGGAGGEETEGARLIALNMALNGTPREETERYLEENYDLADPHGLLDEVYARVK